MRTTRGGRGTLGITPLLVAAGCALALQHPSQADSRTGVAGLSGPVRIVRDHFGVPHISGATLADTMLGLGYVHAQDRRFQMELFRRAANGRLAEIVGESMLDSDRLMRTLGIAELARREAERLPPADHELYAAYAAGVNAATEAGAGRSWLFRLVGVTAEAWTPADSLAILKLIAWGLTSKSHQQKLLMASLRREVGDAARLFMPPYPDGWAPALCERDCPASTPLSGATDHAAAERWDPAAVAAALDAAALRLDAPGVGSNAWVIAGRRSSSGAPLLASDPHLPFMLPSMGYAAHLIAADVEVIGATVSGIPGIQIGHNRTLAWGLTNVGADVQDLFVELIRDGDPPLVRDPSGWTPLRTRQETIRVRGRKEPVVLTVRSSPRGPLMTDLGPAFTSGLPAEAPEGGTSYALSLAWTLLEPAEPHAYLGLDRAQDWTAFEATLRGWSLAPQNVVYADVHGNIGYQLAGRVPVRAGPPPEEPVPGWEPQHQWIGVVPFDALPRAFNPAEGMIASANARVTGAAYPYYISARWDDIPLRLQRIQTLLNATPVLSLDAVAAIQLDVHAEELRDVLAWTHLVPDPDPVVRAFQSAADTWDGSATTASTATARAEMLRLELFDGVFGARLSPALYDRYREMWNVPTVALSAAMADPDAVLFGADPPAARAARVQALVRAAHRADATLTERLGNPTRWAWGPLHTLTFEHPFAQLGGFTGGVAAWALNLGPFECPGSWFTVNPGPWQPANPFAVAAGAVYRQIVDLGDFSRSRYVPPPPGQSEHRFSRHYGDLAEPWVAGAYQAMPWSAAEIEADAEAVLVLTPAGPP